MIWVTLTFVSGPSGAPTMSAFEGHPSASVACRGVPVELLLLQYHRAASAELLAVAKRSRERRCADNNSARCALKDIARQEKAKTAKAAGALFQSSKRQSEYQGYRGATPDRIGNAMPVLIGAAMIAAAILLSTLITAVGTRFAGMESPNEENLWLIDRLTGSVYRCQAPERGKAACEAEVATGSLGERSKH